MSTNLPLFLDWLRVEACAFVVASQCYSAWFVACVPIVRTLRFRERHISDGLGGFLLAAEESWEMFSVIQGLYMQMLGVLLPLRQVWWRGRAACTQCWRC